MVPFHLAFPVVDLKKTVHFYTEILGCKLGRSALHWIDIDFYGHQLTAQENPKFVDIMPNKWRKDQAYPIVDFGAVLGWKDWHDLEKRLKDQDYPFIIEPHVAFLGEVGEQKSMFLEDPSGYAVEFKTFENPDRLFQSEF
jgi:extradiol dioxygenase family protein